jgi:hypothetical protein
MPEHRPLAGSWHVDRGAGFLGPPNGRACLRPSRERAGRVPQNASAGPSASSRSVASRLTSRSWAGARRQPFPGARASTVIASGGRPSGLPGKYQAPTTLASPTQPNGRKTRVAGSPPGTGGAGSRRGPSPGRTRKRSPSTSTRSCRLSGDHATKPPPNTSAAPRTTASVSRPSAEKMRRRAVPPSSSPLRTARRRPSGDHAIAPGAPAIG